MKGNVGLRDDSIIVRELIMKRQMKRWLILGGVALATIAAHAQPPDMLLHRFPHHAFEDAMEMTGRKASQPGQLLQCERVVEVFLYMHQHP